MARGVSLVRFFLQVRPLYRTKAPKERIDRFGPKKTDFFATVNDYLADLKANPRKYESASRSGTIASNPVKSGRTVRGYLGIGEYNLKMDIRDVNSWNVVHNQTTDQASELALYYQFNIPTRLDFGLLCLERYGNRTALAFIIRDLPRFFRSQHPGFYLEISPVMDDKVVLDSMNRTKRIKALRLLRVGIPKKARQKLNIQTNMTQAGSIEHRLNVRFDATSSIRRMVKEFLDSDRSPQSMKEIFTVDSFTPHDVKILFDDEGSERTLDLLNPQGLRPYISISKEVQRDASGKALYNSIDAIATRELDAVIDSLVQT